MAASVLHGLLWAFLGGESVPERFAEALLVFLPKGERAGVRARRSAVAMRPLGLMNIDAYVVLAAVAHSLSAYVAANAQEEQHGVVKGRQSVQHVLNTNHASSCVLACCAVDFPPVLAWPLGRVNSVWQVDMLCLFRLMRFRDCCRQSVWYMHK